MAKTIEVELTDGTWTTIENVKAVRLIAQTGEEVDEVAE